MDNSNYSKAGDLLGGLMDMMGANGGSEIAKLFQTWRAIVGDDLASHSAVEDIRNGTVIVLVDHPAWMQLLKQKERYILARLQREFTQLSITRMLCKIGVPKIKHDRPAAAAQMQESVSPGGTENPEHKPEHAEPGSTKESFLASMERLKKTLEEKASE